MVADPVRAYAEAVVAGEIVAGRLVRLACARHLADLGHAAERGLRFDEQAAQKALAFFGFLCLAEGEFAGKPFVLQLWQQFIVGSLFGWKGPDGFRRFRKAYIEVAKGNGKTPSAAGIGLYGLVADGEEGAEVYSAATTRDQAGILFADAKHMVEASPALSNRVEVNVSNLAFAAQHSFFRPVSSEARSLDGKRVHVALIDELHEHPSNIVVEKMQAGTKGRRQPLIIEVTNAGYDRQSVCYQHHEYSAKVVEGVIPDDGWFGYVCGLDEGDDWQDEAVWVKANPNIGVSVTWKYLREQVREAAGMPGKQNIVKRLNFCIWTEQADRWLDMDVWDGNAGQVDEARLVGRDCYAGLDMSSTTDLTALELVFCADDGSMDVLSFAWVPEDNARQRAQRDRVPYPLWIDQGYIRATEGNVVDYDVVRRDIGRLGERFRIRELAIDRWNSTQLQTQLMGDGFTVVPTGQGFASMSAPTKALEALLLARKLRHGGNPVLRWAASNVAVATDAAGNVKPAKDRSTERIDPIVALVMAIDRASRAGNVESIYEQRGVIVL